MSFVFADRVQQISTSFGLGDFTLGAAPLGFETFIDRVGDTNECYYTIVDDTTGAWEGGVATITAPDQLQRTTFKNSSTGAPVDFAPGNKTVLSGPSAEAFIERITELQHAAIDHQAGVTGVPAPEAFTEIAHDAHSHTGVPGIPAPEAFTEVVHDAHSHAGVPGVPVISAPSPQTYTVNRITSLVTVDLTASTDGIHFVSLDSAGADFDTLQVDIPPAPTDATPFLVIFNEDIELKGAVLSIKASGFAQLAFLNPREGVRLWHMGALGTEWQVEKIDASSVAPAEVFYRFAGDTNAAATFFYARNETTITVARQANLTDNFVSSQTRFLHLSYAAAGTGVGDTNLSILDEAPAVVETPVLTGGVQNEVIDVDFTVLPNVSGSPVDDGSFGLRYDSGGDKGNNSFVLYGYQRDGGHELHFSHVNNGTSDNIPWCGPSQFGTSAPTVQGEYQYRMPNSGFIDRVVIVTENTATCDLDINIDGTTLATAPMSATGDIARMHQFLAPIPVLKNSLLSIETRNWSAAPGQIRILVRVRGIRGGLLQFSGDSAGAIGLFGRADNSIPSVQQETFVAPRDMRLLRWSLSTANAFGGGEQVEVRRNGVIVSEYDPDDATQVVEAGGILFSAGQLLTVEMTSFSESLTVLLHMTAEPLTF